MKVIRYPQLSPLSNKCCVTIGNFDGVHQGHQQLIKEVVKQAKQRNCLATVVTMNPLPQQYFSGKYAIDILTDLKLKAQLMKKMDVDVLCVLNFNDRLASMQAIDFYQKILKSGLNSQYILVGDDFRFGANRQGGFDELSQWGQFDDIVVKRMSSIEITDTRVSSTVIRALLAAGDFSRAKALLGRDFKLIGRVAHGRKKGRELGFPTLNLELRQGGFPLHGIYFTKVKIGSEFYPSVTSVGHNPTVGGNAKRVEVHVLDFNQEIYGQTVEVLFYKKLRNEVEFGSLTELTDAIAHDVKIGREFFAR